MGNLQEMCRCCESTRWGETGRLRGLTCLGEIGQRVRFGSLWCKIGHLGEKICSEETALFGTLIC